MAADGHWIVAVAGYDPTTTAVLHALGDAGLTLDVVVVAADADRATLAERLAARADGVLSLLAFAEGPLGEGLRRTLTLTQALGDAGADAPLWLVTRGGVDTGPADRVDDPEQALIWGLGRIVALEHADRWGGLVDLPTDVDERAAERLLAAVTGEDDEDQVAIRVDGRYLRRLGHAPRPTRVAGGLRPDGPVLITGGTGALGATVARWLAERGAPHLILLSRRGPDAPGAADLVTELAELGATASVVACDAGDRDALAAVLAEHPVRAVVHAAGLLDDGTVDTLTTDQVDRVLAAKVAAARHLDELTRDRDLSAFVLFSSIAASIGIPGQGNYAPGNAYLDALAEQRRADGLAATSIAWGPWAGGGMAADAAVGDLMQRHGITPMDPQIALAALQQALDDDATTLTVADLDWDRLALALTAGRRRPLIEDLPEVQRAIGAGAVAASGPLAAGGPAESLATALAALPEAARERALIGLVREQAALVLGHAGPDAVDPNRPFRELGFDSLAGVELRNRLRTVTGLRLSTTLVFDHPTPAVLAAHLHDELTGTLPARPTDDPATVRGPDEPIAIVAMACRYPGNVNSPADLWRLLDDGGDAIGGFPVDRGWDLTHLYHPDPDHPGTSTTRHGGFLYDVADFDPTPSASRHGRHWLWTRSSGSCWRPRGRRSNGPASTRDAARPARRGLRRPHLPGLRVPGPAGARRPGGLPAHRQHRERRLRPHRVRLRPRRTRRHRGHRLLVVAGRAAPGRAGPAGRRVRPGPGRWRRHHVHPGTCSWSSAASVVSPRTAAASPSPPTPTASAPPRASACCWSNVSPTRNGTATRSSPWSVAPRSTPTAPRTDSPPRTAPPSSG